MYHPAEHVRIATLPGLWERTITVGSAGKSFCVTGWRVGWLIGPEQLLNPVLAAQTRIVFCTNSPLQEGVAKALIEAESNGFFNQQVNDYVKRRDALCCVLKKIGIAFTIPEGSYFIAMDTCKIVIPEKDKRMIPDGLQADWVMSYWMTTVIGVAAIPMSAFYINESSWAALNTVRLCFCKDDATLNLAAERLERLSNCLVNE